MNLQDEIPVFILHLLEGDIPQDTCVVQEDINLAEVIDGSLDDLIAFNDRVVVCDGNTTLGLDLFDNLVGS